MLLFFIPSALSEERLQTDKSYEDVLRESPSLTSTQIYLNSDSIITSESQVHVKGKELNPSWLKNSNISSVWLEDGASLKPNILWPGSVKRINACNTEVDPSWLLGSNVYIVGLDDSTTIKPDIIWPPSVTEIHLYDHDIDLDPLSLQGSSVSDIYLHNGVILKRFPPLGISAHRVNDSL